MGDDSKRVERHRYRATPGPVPTLAQTAEQVSWMWCKRGVNCGHSAVIPLSAAIACVGPDSIGDDLGRRLVCTKCGKRRPTFTLPSWGNIQIGLSSMPPASKVAAGMLRYWPDIRARVLERH